MTKPHPHGLEALRLVALLDADEWPGSMTLVSYARACAAELRRLAAENAALRQAYRAMKNSAAGCSNYCNESASTRRCDREFTEAEELFRAAMQKETP